MLLIILLFPVLNYSQWNELDSPKGNIFVKDIFKVKNSLVAYHSKQLYRSSDDGKIWEKVNSQGLDSIISFDFVKCDDENIYIGLTTLSNKVHGIFKSSDLGKTFIRIYDEKIQDFEIKNGIVYILKNQHIIKLNIETKLKDSIYLGKSPYSYNKIDFFDDNIIISDRGSFSSNPPIINDGIIYSNDNGFTWKEWNLGLGRDFALYYFVYFTDDISYIGTNKGFYKSFGFGERWEKYMLPINSQEINNILIDNNDMYISTKTGEIYHSNDNGLNLNIIYFDNMNINISKIKKINGRIFFTSSLGVFEIENGIVNSIELKDKAYYTKVLFDNNKTYIFMYPGIQYSEDNLSSWKILYDSINPKIFKNNRFEMKDSLIIAIDYSQNILSISRDLGKSWVDTNVVPLGDNLQEIKIFDDVVTCISNKNFLYSYDNGLNWINYSENNSGFNTKFRKIYKISQTTFLASTYNDGILISTDKFQNWNKINSSEESLIYNETTNFISINKNKIISPKIEYDLIDQYNYSYISDNLFYSSDFGITWELKKFSENKVYIFDMMNYKENIFLATSKGFYYSTNFGNSWAKYNNGLDIFELSVNYYTQPIRDMEVINGSIYLAYGNKILGLPLSELGIEYTSVEKTEKRNYLYTFPPFPQPSKQEVKISTYWDSALPFTIDDVEIYNLAGIKINTENKLSINKETNYNGHIIWDTSGEQAGIYIVNIKHGTETRTQKVMVEK